MLKKYIEFFLKNPLFVGLFVVVIFFGGLYFAPFDISGFFGNDRNSIAVDAIPDIGENQQIVFTKWSGKSPQDIDDQITYPLSSALLGIPGIKTIRSSSMFGFSSIYIIFKDNVPFYWSRARIIEKLNSLPAGLLPDGVKPALGPDATALGQVYWYTLEGRDSLGNATGGWNLDELRTTQDYYVKYALSSADGVSEVASIGGYVKEFQVDVSQDKLKAYNLSIQDVLMAIKKSNIDVGARTIEFNGVEYFVRGVGYIKKLEDLKNSIVKMVGTTPIHVEDIARVKFGPAPRRGILDKGGAEVVGGVVIARYGENPLKTIQNVKKKIALISKGLPIKKLKDGTISKLTIVPFYDRTGLIYETLGTLKDALSLEIIITILVIIIMVLNLRTSIIISSLIPFAVLSAFIAMKIFGVNANIVALSGIAIAIGTVVDMGIVLSENILKHFQSDKTSGHIFTDVYKGAIEVAPSILTALSTTVVSFLPVFTLQASEGKLFKPLAFTKSFVLIASLIITFTVLPALANLVFSIKFDRKKIRRFASSLLTVFGIYGIFAGWGFIGFLITFLGLYSIFSFNRSIEKYTEKVFLYITLFIVTYLLAIEWLPLGPSKGVFFNLFFVVLILAVLMGFLTLIIKYYSTIIEYILQNRKKALLVPIFIIILGLMIWLGAENFMYPITKPLNKIGLDLNNTAFVKIPQKVFPGIGKEFMPALNEGSFLLMPTTMPHAGQEEVHKMLSKLDISVQNIPEVSSVVGKAGRVESPLDPAPLSMFENLILYKSEYKRDKNGNRIRFKVNKNGKYVRNKQNKLIPDKNGQYFRQWRDNIHSPDDIWKEIIKHTKILGLTSAPKLQPIQTRLVMLQTGMRAPIGIKIKGNNLETLDKFGLKLEKILPSVDGINKASVFADRLVGKPYIEIALDRKKMALYGLKIADVQSYINTAIGGKKASTAIIGRDRFNIRLRYQRELRDNPNVIAQLSIKTPLKERIELSQIAKITYKQGPQVIKSEDGFLVSYVIFDKINGYSGVDVVHNAQKKLDELVLTGKLKIPKGLTYQFTGNYENQLRAEKRFKIIVPIVMILIFLIIYLQFKDIALTIIIFSGMLIAFSGGMIVVWLWGKSWFLNFYFMGNSFRGIFHMKEIYLSVAVWVGVISLFGIATDNGVLITGYFTDLLKKNPPKEKGDIAKLAKKAGLQRIRPAMMTTATTMLALLPIFTSTGKGSDVMMPMAIPIFGGMVFQVLTIFIIPLLFTIWKEFEFSRGGKK